jgi:hypothetical protein
MLLLLARGDDESGAVVRVDVGGRLFNRDSSASE